MRALAAAGVAFFWSAAALAHHGSSDQFMQHMQPMTRARVGVEGSEFEIAGQRGNVLSAAARADYAFSPDFGLGVRVPHHTLWIEGQGRTSGLGDLDLVGLFRLHNGEHPVSAGLTLEIPTGDESKGIGSGHAEFSPFLAGGTDLGPVMLHGALGASFSVSHGHEDGAGESDSFNFVTPHAPREVQYHLGVIRRLSDDVYANAIVSGFTPLERSEAVGHVLLAGAELGARAGDDRRLTLKAEAPFAGNARFDWKLGFALDLLF